MNKTKPMPELWRDLPPDLQQEVRDFAEFLLQKRGPSEKPLQLKWAGALRQERDLTAADLQQEVLENWGD